MAKSHIIPRTKSFDQRNKGKSKLKSVVKANEARYEKMKNPVICALYHQIGLT
jgi:hypothetical protein